MVEELVGIALNVGVYHHGAQQSVWKIRQILGECHFGKHLLQHIKDGGSIGCLHTHSSDYSAQEHLHDFAKRPNTE